MSAYQNMDAASSPLSTSICGATSIHAGSNFSDTITGRPRAGVLYIPWPHATRNTPPILPPMIWHTKQQQRRRNAACQRSQAETSAGHVDVPATNPPPLWCCRDSSPFFAPPISTLSPTAAKTQHALQVEN